MPTIIDSLLIKLGYDTSAVTAGAAKVDKALKQTGSTADDASKQLKKNSDGFENVAKSAVKFLAVIGGAATVKRFAEQLIESSAALDRLSKNLGESVDTVSAWSNAAELAGGSASGLQGTMSMLSKAQTEIMLTGESHIIPYFSALGLSVAKAGEALTPAQMLLDMTDKISEMSQKFGRPTANNLGLMMGVDQGTLSLLLQGRVEVERVLKQQKEFGAVSKQQAEESTRLNRALIESKQNFAAFGRELLSSATPMLEKLFGIFADIGNWMRENKEFVQGFLIVLAGGLTALGLSLVPVNATALAVGALAAAFAALYDDYKTWAAGGDSLFDWTNFVAGINVAKDALKGLKSILEGLFYRWAAFIDAEVNLVHGDFAGAKRAFGEMISGNQPETTVGGQTAGGKIGAPIANAPRGIRNNNPGNLNFAGQTGASKETGPSGRFAVFGSMQEGVAALVKQIGLYVKRGKNTIRQIIETYAPAFENDTGAYISAVSRALGIGPDDPLDVDNIQQIGSLVRAIATHENGKGYLSEADISGGFKLARGIPNATQVARSSGAVASVPSAPAAIGRDRSVQTTIGQITVNTAATDANGIAKDMGKSMDYLFASQADYGSF